MNGQASTIDARVQKTRVKLRMAALELAASSPIESVSVSELCRVAGIDRATFYRHANTPTEVLTLALVDDLDSIRDSFLAGVSGHEVSLRELWREITHTTVLHVNRFEAVYHSGFGEGSTGSLEKLFRDHVQKSIELLLSENTDLLPLDSAANLNFVRTAMAAALASSLSAILRSWLASSPRSEAAYLEAVLLSLPSWLTSEPLSGSKELPKRAKS